MGRARESGKVRGREMGLGPEGRIGAGGEWSAGVNPGPQGKIRGNQGSCRGVETGLMWEPGIWASHWGDSRGVRPIWWTPIPYPSFPDSVNEQRWTRKVGEMGRKPRASSGGTTSS